MRYCSNCKNIVKDEDLFCTHCGQKMEAFTSQEINNNVKYNNPKINRQDAPKTEMFYSDGETKNTSDNNEITINEINSDTVDKNTVNKNNHNKDVPKGKKKNKKILKMIVAFSVVMIIAAAIVVICFQVKKRININSCIDVSFEGVDGDGSVKCSINYDKLEDEILKAQGKESLDYSLKDKTGLEEFKDIEVKMNISKEKGLSNGDDVVVETEIDSQIAKDLNVNFVSAGNKYTVSSLMPGNTDIFNDVDVKFVGKDPDISVEITNNTSNEALKTIQFVSSKIVGIKDGDTVTVTAIYDTEKMKQAGIIAKERTKEFKCEKTNKRITSFDDLTDDNKNSLKSEAENKINSYFSDNSEYLKSTELKYEGTYWLTLKSDISKNNIIMVYSVDVENIKPNDENKFDKTLVYMPVSFSNIRIQSDGGIEYDANALKGETSLKYGTGKDVVSGYLTAEDMFKTCVISKAEDKEKPYIYSVTGNVVDIVK